MWQTDVEVEEEETEEIIKSIVGGELWKEEEEERSKKKTTDYPISIFQKKSLFRESHKFLLVLLRAAIETSAHQSFCIPGN